ncbi:hypothetical protein HYW83_05730 [Candidatus Peregrinibacteria bacterium]|nr:hypothetical protein [Candidatus Peregrinibacteria bacterium]
MARPAHGGDSPESKRPTEKQKRDLRYLQTNIEKPFPPEVNQLLEFFDEEEKAIAAKIEKLRASFSPGDLEAQEQINIHESRYQDLFQFRKLLIQNADNPNVQKVSAAMNHIYEVIFGSPAPSEFEERSFANKVRDFLHKSTTRVPGGYEMLHATYVKGNERLDDTLDAAQTDHLLMLLETGNPETLFETYVTSMDRYRELLDKILLLPKPERDKNIDILQRTASFYGALGRKEFQESIKAEIHRSAREVLEKQETQFKGLRGFIQRGIEKGTDFAIDHLSAVFGDKDSLLRNIFIKAAKTGRDLAKPVQYDPELIDEVAEETIAQLSEIGSDVDLKVVQKMDEACRELKANPDHLLKESDTEDFRETFKEFLPVTVAVQEKIIAVHGAMLHDAYVLSHGENSQEFEADWTLRAKFLSVQGRDLIRFMRIAAPFGIFLPDQVERKGDKPPLHLRTVYHQGWLQEHPIISTGLQGVEMAVLLKVAYEGSKIVANRFLVTKLIGKLLGKPLSKIMPVVGQIYLGYEIGTELNNYRLSAVEKEIFERLNEYNSFEEIPSDEVEEIRQLTLRNEIEKRRGLFQAVGYDLGNLDMSVWNRIVVGNVGEGIVPSIRDNMKQTGVFREAVLAANRKLVLLGFEPYEIR